MDLHVKETFSQITLDDGIFLSGSAVFCFRFDVFNNEVSLEFSYLYLLKGSLRTTIFSKYTELLQLKHIFRIFSIFFLNILEINIFQNKNQSLCKKQSYF